MRWILDLERTLVAARGGARKPCLEFSAGPDTPRPPTVSPSRKRRAKVAVLDERAVLVCSAELTTSGITAKAGGRPGCPRRTAARCAVEQLRALRREGCLSGSDRATFSATGSLGAESVTGCCAARPLVSPIDLVPPSPFGRNSHPHHLVLRSVVSRVPVSTRWDHESSDDPVSVNPSHNLGR